MNRFPNVSNIKYEQARNDICFFIIFFIKYNEQSMKEP